MTHGGPGLTARGDSPPSRMPRRNPLVLGALILAFCLSCSTFWGVWTTTKVSNKQNAIGQINMHFEIFTCPNLFNESRHILSLFWNVASFPRPQTLKGLTGWARDRAAQMEQCGSQSKETVNNPTWHSQLYFRYRSVINILFDPGSL